MGDSYFSGRHPQIVAKFPIKISASILVFPSLVGQQPQGQPVDYYPYGYVFPDITMSGNLSIPSVGSAGWNLTIGVGYKPNQGAGQLPGAMPPIPIWLRLNGSAANITNNTGSGTPYAEIGTFRPISEVNFPGQGVHAYTLLTTTFSTSFTVDGEIEVIIDCSEAKYTGAAGVCGIGPCGGGNVLIRGTVAGQSFTAYSPTIGDDKLSTGTTVFSDLTANLSAAGSWSAGIGYHYNGSPAAHAEGKVRLVMGGSEFVTENMQGERFAAAGGGGSDCRNGVSVNLPAQPATAPAIETTQRGCVAAAHLSGAPSSSYRIRGVVRALEAPYPDPLKINVGTQFGIPIYGKPPIILNRGTFDTGIIRRRSFMEIGSVSVGRAGASPVTGNYSHQTVPLTPAPIVLSCDADSLSALGEHPRDYAIKLHGDRWDGFTVRQAKEIFIDKATTTRPIGGDWAGSFDSIGGSVVTREDVETPEGEETDPADPTAAIRFVTPKKYTPPAVPNPYAAGGANRREMGVSRSFTPAAWLTGYRYLEIKIRSLDHSRRPVTVRIGGKLWFTATGEANKWQTVVIDLCDEHGQMNGKALPLVNDRDSIRYAANYDTLYKPGLESPNFGVNQAVGIDFIGTVMDTAYEIGSIRIFRKTAPLLTFLQAYQPQLLNHGVNSEPTAEEKEWGKEWEKWDGGTSVPILITQGITGDTDGRMSLETPSDFYTILGNNRKFQAFTVGNVSNLIGNRANPSIPEYPTETLPFPLQHNTGWRTTTLCLPVTPGLFAFTNSSKRADSLCANRSPLLIWGGGIVWDTGNMANGYRVGIDVPVPDDGLTVPCQILHDTYDFWPGAGDVFGYGATSGDAAAGRNAVTVELRASKLLRGAARNLVVGEGANGDADAAEAEPGTVEYIAATNTIRLKDRASRQSGGEGTAVALGRYETGAPRARITKDNFKNNLGVITPHKRLYDAYMNGSPAVSTLAQRKLDSADSTPKAESLLFLPRHRRRLTFRAAGRAGVSVLSDPVTGFYAKATGRKWAILFQRSTIPVPDIPATDPKAPTQWEPAAVVVTPNADNGEVLKNPTLWRRVDGTLLIRYERQVPPSIGSPPHSPWARSIMETLSNDDGDTWDKAILIMANARQPEFFPGAQGDAGAYIAVHLVPTEDDPNACTLSAQRFDGGGVSGGRFDMQALQTDGTYKPMKIRTGAGYSGTKANDTSGRWLMTLTIAGDDAPTDWVSADDCYSWQKLADS